MKKVTIIAALFVAAVGVTTVNAENTSRRSAITIQADEKVEIKKEELPTAVTTALAGNDYKGWEITKAYQYKESGNFEVELKNGDQSKTVKLDKEGKVIG
jgi:hypothetical protein